MREAVLEELGLLPLWQLRSKSAAVTDIAASGPELTAVKVLREDGAPGWILLSEALAEDAAALFANMLRAMRLRQTETSQLGYDQLIEVAGNSGVQWVWMMGETATRRVLATELSVAELSRQALRWQNLPVFASLHPRELLLRPQEKSGVWVGWCGWLQKVD